MHKTKVNTKTSAAEKNAVLRPEYIGSIATPHDWRTTQTTLPRAPEVGPQPPLRYEGGTLGLCDDVPDVYCCTPGGPIFTTDIEYVLHHIDLFAEPDRSRLLFTAGMHFGLDPWLMIDRNYQQPQEAQRIGEQA